MDLPCPKCNSTDLQQVSLACEEVFYRCDKRAQFHGVLVVSRGPEVLVIASTRKDRYETTLAAQGGEMMTHRICRNTSAHLLSSETFVVQISIATAASRSLLAARRQTRVAGRTLRTES